MLLASHADSLLPFVPLPFESPFVYSFRKLFIRLYRFLRLLILTRRDEVDRGSQGGSDGARIGDGGIHGERKEIANTDKR